MAQAFSERFGPAIEAWLEAEAKPALRGKVEALRQAYEKGGSSAGVDLAAYLTVRAPATFAAIAACLKEVNRLVPDFDPKVLCDLGAGPGTAAFAAAGIFGNLKQAELIEADARFAALARTLSSHLPFSVDLKNTSLMSPLPQANLSIAAYVLAELPLDQIKQVARHLWCACGGVMVLVEPGTPEGFARMKAAREELVAQGAHIIGPCTHAQACPMAQKDWCHFKVRLQRSRAHMHAKHGHVPFEDESYSWLALARFPVQHQAARIVAPVRVSKVAVTLKLCSDGSLRDVAIASRDKAQYKHAKKLIWGETYPAQGTEKT